MLLGSLSIVTNVCDISNQLQLSVFSVCPQKTAFDLKSIWRFLEKKYFVLTLLQRHKISNIHMFYFMSI